MRLAIKLDEPEVKGKALEIIRGTKELLDSPQKWTKLSFARDKEGHRTSADSEDAVCWCLDGALFKVAQELEGEDVGEFVFDPMLLAEYAILEALTNKSFPQDIWLFNDHVLTSFDDVQKALDRAEQYLEEEVGIESGV